MNDLLQKVIAWYNSGFATPSNDVCLTRDHLQAKLDTFYRELVHAYRWPSEEAALLIAAVAEMGNNCFDHNLGKWTDQAGCWFSWGLSDDKWGLCCAISDRGQGILNSLKRVLPELKTEGEALKVAFEKKVSGRSPEQRGNGLKFVRSIFNENQNRGLFFASGSSRTSFGKNPEIDQKLGSKLPSLIPSNPNNVGPKGPSFARDELSITDKIEKKQGTGTLAVIFWKHE